YLQRLPLPELRDLFMPLVPAGTDRRYLEAISPLIHERVQRVQGAAIGPQGTPLREAGAAFPPYTAFFFPGDDLDYPPNLWAPKRVAPASARALAGAGGAILGGWPVGETGASEETLRRLAGERGVRAGALSTPLRVAVTGSTASPPLFETLAVLGPER